MSTIYFEIILKVSSRIELIEQLARERGIDEKDLATLIGIKPVRLSNWKSKRDALNEPALAELSKLAAMTESALSKLPAKGETSGIHDDSDKPLSPEEYRVILVESLETANNAAAKSGRLDIAHGALDLLAKIDMPPIKSKSDSVSYLPKQDPKAKSDTMSLLNKTSENKSNKPPL